MLVNEVNAETYLLEPTAENFETIEVKEGGFTVKQQGENSYLYECSVELKNVFKSIDINNCKVEFEENKNIVILPISIGKVLFNSLDVGFTHNNDTLTKFNVIVRTSNVTEYPFKLNKLEIRRTAEESINANGVYGYYFKPRQLLTNTNLDALIEKAEEICFPVLKKYSATRNYAKATWKGNLSLTAGLNFLGKSIYESEPKKYDCLSVETKLGENFRQTVKGREVIIKA